MCLSVPRGSSSGLAACRVPGHPPPHDMSWGLYNPHATPTPQLPRRSRCFAPRPRRAPGSRQAGGQGVPHPPNPRVPVSRRRRRQPFCGCFESPHHPPRVPVSRAISLPPGASAGGARNRAPTGGPGGLAALHCVKSPLCVHCEPASGRPLHPYPHHQLCSAPPRCACPRLSRRGDARFASLPLIRPCKRHYTSGTTTLPTWPPCSM